MHRFLFKRKSSNMNLSSSLDCFSIISFFYQSESALEAMIWGGIFGFSTYAVLNLTELAINSKWTVFTASVDMIWGTVNCASSSILAERIAKRGLFWYMFLFLDILVMFVLLFRAKKSNVEKKMTNLYSAFHEES